MKEWAMPKRAYFLMIVLCIFAQAWAEESRFNQLLDEILFESADIVSRLNGYKKLIEYAQRRELDAQNLGRLIKALEGTYRSRDLSNKSVLLGLRDLLGEILKMPIFGAYHKQVHLFQEKLKYDLMPFAVKFGDYVMIESCERRVFCATQQRDGNYFLYGCGNRAGKQVRIDSLFRIGGGIAGQPVLFGQDVQICPVYLQNGEYVLPSEVELNISYHREASRGFNGKALFLDKKPDVKFSVVASIGNILHGLPVVAGHGFRLVDVASNFSWVLSIDNTLIFQPKTDADCELFSLRIVKPQVVEKAYQKLVQANTAIAIKKTLAEDRIAGLTKILKVVRGGIDGVVLVQQQELLQSLYGEREKLASSELRSLKKLFDLAAGHSSFVQSKFSFEQYAGQLLEDLGARALKFEEFITITSIDHRRAIHLVMDEQLSKQGHLVVSGDGIPSSKIAGQQCMMISSVVGKQGFLSYGDEIKLTSFFVHDGRAGGLLACPVVWWVDGNPVTRVCASSSKAVQTRSGQEVFIVASAASGLVGPVLPGDRINLVSKYAQGAISFMQATPALDIQKVSRDRLTVLADKCFSQYVKQVKAIQDIDKKLPMLEAAVDLFKDQKILSSGSGKVLYSALKQATADKNSITKAFVPNLQGLLAKAQNAPFSPAAKKRFVVWSDSLCNSST